MADLTTTVDTYLSAYNETDPALRLSLLERAFTPTGRLIDPPLGAEGRQGISDMMAAVHEQFPGHTFRRSSGIDEHHGFLRYGWELLGPDRTVVLAGMDVGELDSSMQLVRVTGFLGPLPPDEPT